MTKPAALSVDEEEPHQTNGNANDFVPRERFMIEQIADGEQGDGEECALYDKAGAHLPTCFERVDPPGLQTNDCDAKDGRSNIQVLVFTHLRAVKSFPYWLDF